MLVLTTLNKKANVVLVKPRFSFCKSQQVISKVLTPNSFFLVMHEQKIWLNRFCQTKFACLAVGNFIFYFILELINVKCQRQYTWYPVKLFYQLTLKKNNTLSVCGWDDSVDASHHPLQSRGLCKDHLLCVPNFGVTTKCLQVCQAAQINCQSLEFKSHGGFSQWQFLIFLLLSVSLSLPFVLVQEFTGPCSETAPGISDPKGLLDPVHLAR